MIIFVSGVVREGASLAPVDFCIIHCLKDNNSILDREQRQLCNVFRNQPFFIVGVGMGEFFAG